jgi:hypothetical protein
MTKMSDEGMTEEEMTMLVKVIKFVVNSILGNEDVDPPVQEYESTNEKIPQEYWEPNKYLKLVPPSVIRGTGRPKKQRRVDGNEAAILSTKHRTKIKFVQHLIPCHVLYIYIYIYGLIGLYPPAMLASFVIPPIKKFLVDSPLQCEDSMLSSSAKLVKVQYRWCLQSG